MRVRSLSIHHLPGIRPGFEVGGFDPSINLVIGPNASGKTSLLRALRALLYREESPGAGVHLEAEFETAGGPLRVVRLGRDVHWSREGQPVDPPVLPDRRFCNCYILQVEDLLQAGNAEQEIGERIARELAGGYDLDAVLRLFVLRDRVGQGEAVALRQAEGTLAARRAGHIQLRQDEARLETLKQQHQEALVAQRETESLQRALDALEAHRDRRGWEARLEDYPSNMERLRGDELDRLAQLRQQRQGLEEERERAERDGQDALQRLQRSRLDGVDLDEGRLAEQQRTLEHLRALEQEIQVLRKEEVQTRADLAAAVHGLGGEPEVPVQVDPSTIAQVEGSLAAKRELDTRVASLDAEIQRLPEEEPDWHPDTLRSGRQELMAWLAAPRQLAWSGSRWGGLLLLLGSLVAAVAGAAWTAHLAFLMLLLLAVAGLYVLLRTGDEGDAQRRETQDRYQATGLAGPSSWNPAGVRQRLQELDRQLQEAGARVADLRRREEVGRARQQKEEQRQQHMRVLQEVAREVGFDPARLDASFDRWLRLMQAFDAARREVTRVEGQVLAKAQEAEPLRDGVYRFLDTYGEVPVDLVNPVTLGDRLNALAARLRLRDQAVADHGAAAAALKRAETGLEQADAAIRDLYLKAGLEPGDEHAVWTRLDQLESWQQLCQKLQDARSVEADRKRVLQQRPDLLERVEAEDEDFLQQTLTACSEQAAQAEELHSEIVRIEQDIQRAQRERSLEEARAARQQAEDALRGKWEEALRAAAGRFLLEKVAAEHETHSQPPVLQRARDWFGRFTRHQFELLFHGDDEPRFSARETASGERRSLQELSSGTTMQLLLAVRLAFALEIERGGEPLPFFLDEALTTSDPERFGAVVDSLRTLANEGRQVFYLTAQPHDVPLWEAGGSGVRVIDLGQVRRLGTAVASPGDLALPARPAPPAPAHFDTPEEYAQALGVPPIDPWAGASAIHVFYLLRDDLPLLQRLVEAGIEHAGALRSLLRSAARGALLTATETRLLEGRLAMLDAWHAAWQRGRGRPVDRASIEHSPVGGRFTERVAEVAATVGGDARRLLDALQDGAVPRFRRAAMDDLRQWLIEHGYLDEREPACESDLHLALLAAGPLADGAEAGAADAARWLLDSLMAGVGAGDVSGRPTLS